MRTSLPNGRMHLESDSCFRFIIGGYIEPWKLETQEQNLIVMRIVTDAAAVTPRPVTSPLSMASSYPAGSSSRSGRAGRSRPSLRAVNPRVEGVPVSTLGLPACVLVRPCLHRRPQYRLGRPRLV